MFEQNNSETPKQGDANTQTTNQPDALTTLLAEIKNERGEQKYKDPLEGLNALKHSQEYISTLKEQNAARDRELAQLREQVTKFSGLEDTVRQLTQRKEPTETPSQSFDEEKLAAVVAAQLQRANQEAQARANKEAVEQALTKQFGDKAKEVFYSKAQELGMAQEDMVTLASKSPQAVLTMLGVSEKVVHKQTTQAPAGTKVNTAALSVQPGSTYIGRETETIPIGGGLQQARVMMENAKAMVAELHEKGMTVDDLTIPSNYFKHFN